MFAAMLMSAGCGNNASNVANDAANVASNAANDAANVASNAANDAANVASNDATNAASNVANDAANAASNVANDAANVANEAEQRLEEVTADMNEAITGRTVALGGLMPGSTSLEDVQAMFGEATSTDGNVMNFVDGLKVTFDAAQKVKSISTTNADFDTPEGIYVGASEYSLNDYCGPADAIRQITNGAEYEYFSGDKKSKVVYKAQNGVITEITCSLNS